MELGVTEVDIECDSLLTVQALNKDITNYHEVRNILQVSRDLLKECPDISVVFVKNQANKVAHVFARVPCEDGCFSDFSSPPHIVLKKIMYDALMI